VDGTMGDTKVDEMKDYELEKAIEASKKEYEKFHSREESVNFELMKKIDTFYIWKKVKNLWWFINMLAKRLTFFFFGKIDSTSHILLTPKKMGIKRGASASTVSVGPETYRLIDENIPLDKINEYFGYLPPIHIEIHPSVRPINTSGNHAKKVPCSPEYYFEQQVVITSANTNKKHTLSQSSTSFPYLSLSSLPSREVVQATSTAVVSQRQEFFEDKQNRTNFLVWEDDVSYEGRLCNYILHQQGKKKGGSGLEIGGELDEGGVFDESGDEDEKFLLESGGGDNITSSLSLSKKSSYGLRRLVFDFHFNTLLSLRELKKRVRQGFIDGFSNEFNGMFI
jgi:hypothetical protein